VLFICVIYHLFICVVNCKVLSIVDGNSQTKADLVWESEPKYNGKTSVHCFCASVCVCAVLVKFPVEFKLTGLSVKYFLT